MYTNKDYYSPELENSYLGNGTDIANLDFFRGDIFSLGIVFVLIQLKEFQFAEPWQIRESVLKTQRQGSSGISIQVKESDSNVLKTL